jgi:TPR repeat protein
MRKWHPLAEQGDARAQTNLGHLYADGKGVPQNDAKAVKWFRTAAEQGHVSAQAVLGAMYANGRGAPRDNVQAYAWLNIAVAQGYTLAAEARDIVAQRMTSEAEARDQAQRLAQEYWDTYVLPFRD